MAKKQPIDNSGPVNYYEGIFGKGEGAKMYFAFRLIPLLLFSLCGAILITFIAGYLLNIDPLPILGVVGPVFSAPLTFMLGYLYGDKRST